MGMVQDGAGHPTRLTPEREEKYFEAIRKGASHKAACYYAGWTPSAAQRWANVARVVIAKLEDPEQNYCPTPLETEMIAWWQKRMEIEAEMEMKAVGHWVSFFEKDWKAAAAYLAVRFKEDWQPMRANGTPMGLPEDVANQLKGGNVSVQIYLPDNNRDRTAALTDGQEVIDAEVVTLKVEEPGDAGEEV